MLALLARRLLGAAADLGHALVDPTSFSFPGVTIAFARPETAPAARI
ncbi:MAG: hypothetical protein R3D31_09915 [Hyphomicrobiaceae bacterium]